MKEIGFYAFYIVFKNNTDEEKKVNLFKSQPDGIDRKIRNDEFEDYLDFIRKIKLCNQKFIIKLINFLSLSEEIGKNTAQILQSFKYKGENSDENYYPVISPIADVGDELLISVKSDCICSEYGDFEFTILPQNKVYITLYVSDIQ